MIVIGIIASIVGFFFATGMLKRGKKPTNTMPLLGIAVAIMVGSLFLGDCISSRACESGPVYFDAALTAIVFFLAFLTVPTLPMAGGLLLGFIVACAAWPVTRRM